MTLKDYPATQLAGQPAGYWTGQAYRAVVGRIRTELATERLTQPQWWMLNRIDGAPGAWSRASLAPLSRFDDQDIDLDEAVDELVGRGWLTEREDRLTITRTGIAGLARARNKLGAANTATHAGIETGEYIAALDVLRRMIDNLGGDSDIPTLDATAATANGKG